MTRPVTPQEMFDLWQKMVNPGGYPLQSLMFPILDVKEVEKKILELQTVEHWLRANINMLQLSIKSLEYQRAMLKGGEKAREVLENAARGTDERGSAEGEAPNPALWAWNMMAQAGKDAMEHMGKAAEEGSRPATAKKRRRPKGEGGR